MVQQVHSTCSATGQGYESQPAEVILIDRQGHMGSSEVSVLLLCEQGHLIEINLSKIIAAYF